MVIFLSSASSLCSSLTSSGFANFVYECYSLIYNVLRRSRTATRFSLVFSYVQREREEKSSRLRASAFFNRRHIRRVHRRAKKLNLSYFRLRRVALIRLHEQRDRSDVFEQRLRRKKERQESGGQYRDTSARSVHSRVRIVLKQKSAKSKTRGNNTHKSGQKQNKTIRFSSFPRLRSFVF